MNTRHPDDIGPIPPARPGPPILEPLTCPRCGKECTTERVGWMPAAYNSRVHCNTCDIHGAGPDYATAHTNLCRTFPKPEPLAPLSNHAKAVLAELLDRPKPRQQINPGVVYRLSREGLITEIQARSPYAKHNGGLIPHITLTDAGIARARSL